MIEVIKNNYKPLFPKIVVCSKCGSILKINVESDLANVYSRGKVIKKCPCCGENEVKFKEISQVKNGVFVDTEKQITEETSSPSVPISDKENMLEKD